jgi:hypothetical protein
VTFVESVLTKGPGQAIQKPSKIYPNLDFWFKTNHLATLVTMAVYVCDAARLKTVFDGKKFNHI